MDLILWCIWASTPEVLTFALLLWAIILSFYIYSVEMSISPARRCSCYKEMFSPSLLILLVWMNRIDCFIFSFIKRHLIWSGNVSQNWIIFSFLFVCNPNQTSDLFVTFIFAELCRFLKFAKSVFCYISISDKHFDWHFWNKIHTLRQLKQRYQYVYWVILPSSAICCVYSNL